MYYSAGITWPSSARVASESFLSGDSYDTQLEGHYWMLRLIGVIYLGDIPSIRLLWSIVLLVQGTSPISIGGGPQSRLTVNSRIRGSRGRMSPLLVKSDRVLSR